MDCTEDFKSGLAKGSGAVSLCPPPLTLPGLISLSTSSRWLWGDWGRTEPNPKEGSGLLPFGGTHLSRGSGLHCSWQTTDRCHDTLQNHSGAERRTKAGLLASLRLYQDAAGQEHQMRFLLRKIAPFGNQSFLKFDSTRITFLRKVLLQENVSAYFVYKTCMNSISYKLRF